MGTRSKLHKYTYSKLASIFPENIILENHYPDWLISSNNTRLEIDIYIYGKALAFEIQGEQHFRMISFFHKTKEDFQKRLDYDRQKKEACERKGIRLVEICCQKDIDIFCKELSPPRKENSTVHNFLVSEIKDFRKIKSKNLINKKWQSLNKEVARYLSMPLDDVVSDEITRYYFENRQDIDKRIRENFG